MHRINILSVRTITKLQEQWLELHASVDHNALLFKKYNVNNFILLYWRIACKLGFGPGELWPTTITLGLATPLATDTKEDILQAASTSTWYL